MTPLPRLNIERYRDIGAYLHDVRLQQKRTINDIAEELNIRAVHLEAIERSNMEALPGLAYARGFIVAYSEELGLHGETVWTHYQRMQHVEEEVSLYVPKADRLHDLPNKTVRRVSTVMLGLAGLLWFNTLPEKPNSLVDMSILEATAPAETTIEKKDEIAVTDFKTAEIKETNTSNIPDDANAIRDCIPTIASPCDNDAAYAAPSLPDESLLAPDTESQ